MAYVLPVSTVAISMTLGIGTVYHTSTIPGIGTPGIGIPGIVPTIMVDGIPWGGVSVTIGDIAIGIPIGQDIILMVIITIIRHMGMEADTMDMVPVCPRHATMTMEVHASWIAVIVQGIVGIPIGMYTPTVPMTANRLMPTVHPAGQIVLPTAPPIGVRKTSHIVAPTAPMNVLTVV